VSGVGPKIALGILSGLSVAEFLRVVEAEDVAALVRIPGVGRKTAERILIDMRDKTGDLSGTGSAFVPTHTASAPSAHQEATVALVALGYRPQEVVRLLKAAGDDAQTTEELIRRALRAAAG
jgi:Holliday junction DNA helicase RuvA